MSYMKPCGTCRVKISSDANFCPRCGKKRPHGTMLGGLLGLFFTILTLGMLG